MDFGDIGLGCAALLLWGVISIPVGIVIGMAVHLGASDGPGDECHCHNWREM